MTDRTQQDRKSNIIMQENIYRILYMYLVYGTNYYHR